MEAYDQDIRQQSSMSLTTSINDEEPKPGDASQKLKTEKSKAALHCGPELVSYSIHVAAISMTAGVLQLSFRGVYWADEDGWNNNGWSLGLSQPVMAGVLQFAAKIHEIVIIASLSTIVIDIIRRRLLMSLGMPFGFLIGAYQFGSASSLVSGSFWGPFADAIRHHKSTGIALGLLLGLGSIYANAIGPASAVLIVPTLNWWPAYNLTALAVNKFTLYPMMLTTTDWMDAYCHGPIDNLTYGCPGYGANDLQGAYRFTRPQDSANRTFIQRFGTARRNLYTSSTINGSSADSVVRISSTIHSVVLEAIGLGGRFASTFANSDFAKFSIYKAGRPQIDSTDSKNVMSPVVQTDCAAMYRVHVESNNNINLTFPTSLLSTSKDPGRQPLVPNEYWMNWAPQPDNFTNFTWIDRSFLQHNGQMSKASIGALTMVGYDAVSQELSSVGPDTLFLACVFDARWAATVVSYDPVNSDVVSSNITDMSLFSGTAFNKEMRAKYGLGDLINIRTDWADLLNAPTIHGSYDGSAQYQGVQTPATSPGDSQNVSSERRLPAIQAYLAQYMISESENQMTISDYVKPTISDITSQFAKFLSLTLTDGLARVATEDDKQLGMVWDPIAQRNVFFGLDGSGFAVDSGLGVSLDFNVERYGWGYGTQTKTAKFAVSILLIHSVLAVAYMIFTVTHWFLYTVISRSWKNMDNLFALAMVSSKPPSLKGVSAGIGTWDTWKLDVAIRENQETHESIELVFGGRDGEPVGREDGKVQWRKKYD